LSKTKPIVGTFAFSVVCFVFIAPYYLTCSDIPYKTDAVIILVGPGFKKRAKEADKLVKKGVVNYIFIPERFEAIGPFKEQGHIVVKSKVMIPSDSSSTRMREYWKSNQNTYRELLRAKEMIDRYGFKTAVIVSSPYHMRRVKIMCSKIFSEDQYSISCVGTPYEKTRRLFWFLHSYDRHWVLTEYMKLCGLFIDLANSSVLCGR